MVSNKRDLKRALKHCIKSGETALDFETTSLRPAEGRVRLVSLCNRKGCHYLVDFDRIKGGFRAVAKLFEGGTWIVYNAGFELRWFQDAGADAKCFDLAHLRHAILGGGNYRLKQLILWDLDIDLSKEEQNSDWGAKVLTKKQLDYAYGDAHHTWACWYHWAKQADRDHWLGFHMLNDMVPAVIEMEDTGMLLNPKTHMKLVTEWEKVKALRIKRIRRLVPETEVAKLTSDSQWSDYFAARMPDHFLAGWPRTEKTGQLSMKTATLKMLAGSVPGTPLEKAFDALSEFKTISKYLSSFGVTLINHAEVSPDKRIRARFNIAAAKTCRFSSSGPNLQQMPQDRELIGSFTSVRSSFVAGLGRRLVSLDYSGIELRVLALLSGDTQLLQDMVEGDVHSEVAAVIAGHKIDKTTPKGKAARSKAKGVSFGIIYGSGAVGLAVNMRTSIGVAQDYIDFWQDRYPKAFNLRHAVIDEVERTKFVRCIDGGTIYMGKPDLPKCANYPVQRGALSVMAKAIARHKASLDAERAAGKQPMTRMLSTIHDALIDEAATSDAKRCLQIMRDDMIAGYLDVFPNAPTANLLEGGTGPSWSALG
jgi:DNA polymerase-1